MAALRHRGAHRLRRRTRGLPGDHAAVEVVDPVARAGPLDGDGAAATDRDDVGTLGQLVEASPHVSHRDVVDRCRNVAGGVLVVVSDVQHERPAVPDALGGCRSVEFGYPFIEEPHAAPVLLDYLVV